MGRRRQLRLRRPTAAACNLQSLWGWEHGALLEAWQLEVNHSYHQCGMRGHHSIARRKPPCCGVHCAAAGFNTLNMRSTLCNDRLPS